MCCDVLKPKITWFYTQAKLLFWMLGFVFLWPVLSLGIINIYTKRLIATQCYTIPQISFSWSALLILIASLIIIINIKNCSSLLLGWPIRIISVLSVQNILLSFYQRNSFVYLCVFLFPRSVFHISKCKESPSFLMFVIMLKYSDFNFYKK